MSEELKPCPFCGSEARFVKVSDTMGSMKLTAWKVQCSKCWCSPYPNNTHGDKHVVARQWNNRVERTCRIVDKTVSASGITQRECSACGAAISDEECPIYCWRCGAKVIDE